MSRFVVGLILMGFLFSARADVAVLTHHNDLARTGANLNETLLNFSNVNTNQFGLVFTRVVDDQIYAQPLVMTGVNLGVRGTHNLVIVATVNDSVYAFDADSPNVSAPYWRVSFLGPNVVPPTSSDVSCPTFSGNLGIVGTPVIDPSSGTLYVVARTKENGNTFVQRLHALDVATGAERASSPVVIAATYPGTNAMESAVGMVMFNPLMQNQRAGLALLNGVVYICWTSQFDNEPYHGWVMGYDATTLSQVAVYNDTPNGREGGIWMSGQAPAADAAGNLYLSLGNGPVGNTADPQADGSRVESFLKLSPSGGTLTVASAFTPYNWQALDNGDIDLGSAGLLLIPGTSLAFSGGKQGVMYLVNRDNMGGLSSTSADTNIVQSFQASGNEIHGGPAWWDGPDGSYAYVWPAADYLQQYKFNPSSGLFVLPAYAQSPTAAPSSGQPGGFLSVSANGTNAGSGIVWASHQLNGDASTQTLPGILHAYNAQNVGIELWNSEQLPARDSVGNFAKYVPPTVANGKVYLATFSNRLNVYGLLKSQTNKTTFQTNWVQNVEFRLTAWQHGQPTAFAISTRAIVVSLSGLVTNASTGLPITFSSSAVLIRKQSVLDTNAADVHYFVRDGKPAVDSDVSNFLVHTPIASVTYSTSLHVAKHDIEGLSLVNDPTMSFTLSGFGTPTFAAVLRSGPSLLRTLSVDVSGTGVVPAQSASPVVIHGTVTVGGGKLERQ